MKNLIFKITLLITMLLGTSVAYASGHGEGPTVDLSSMYNAANFMSWVILIVVPIVGLYLFWILHIYPERVAEKRNHPQLDAIKTICILSLFFGGIFWPIALIWAYMKPLKFKVKDKLVTVDEPHTVSE